MKRQHLISDAKMRVNRYSRSDRKSAVQPIDTHLFIWGLAALLFLFLVYASKGADIVKLDPARPDLICNEKAIKYWVEQLVHDAPPVGGLVTMLKHWEPHYAKNDKVGELWIITSVVEVQMPDGTGDHELIFAVYHVDTQKSEIAIAMGIPENQLSKYLEVKEK
jgi:hypothetical protein